MSFVSVAPEMVAAAAADLAGIGSAISAANAAAAVPTTEVVAAAADEVSAAIAALFGAHAQEYQAIECAGGGVSGAVCAGVDRGCGGLWAAEAADRLQQWWCWVWSMRPPRRCWGVR